MQVFVPKVFVGVTCESREESFDDCATERFGRPFPRDVVDAREMEVFEHPTQFIVLFSTSGDLPAREIALSKVSYATRSTRLVLCEALRVCV